MGVMYTSHVIGTVYTVMENLYYVTKTNINKFDHSNVDVTKEQKT